MEKIKESYRRIGDEEDRFDIEFWQSQGDQAIFDAAMEMIQDYLTNNDMEVKMVVKLGGIRRPCPTIADLQSGWGRHSSNLRNT